MQTIGKKIFLFLLSTSVLLSFTSCIKHYELKEIAIVQAIGIDYEEELFHLTLQIYSPQGPGGTTAIDTGKNNSTIIKSEGRTLAEAIEKASTTQGNNIFTGHNRVLILGHSFAQNGIRQVFSYFNRSALTRQNVQVLLAEKTAEEIVSTDLIQGILAAETIEKMVKNANKNGLIYETPYYRLSKNMNLYGGCEAIPIISISHAEEASAQKKDAEESESDSSSIQEAGKLQVAHTGLFRDYRLIDTLEEEESRGLLLLSGELKECTLIADDPKFNKVSVNLYSCKVHLSPSLRNGKVCYTLTVKADASLDEVLQPQEVALTEKELQRIETECEKLLSSAAKRCFQTVANKNQTDLLYLSELLRQTDYSFWKAQNGDFSSLLKNASLQTDCTVSIERLGMETDEKVS